MSLLCDCGNQPWRRCPRSEEADELLGHRQCFSRNFWAPSYSLLIPGNCECSKGSGGNQKVSDDLPRNAPLSCRRIARVDWSNNLVWLCSSFVLLVLGKILVPRFSPQRMHEQGPRFRARPPARRRLWLGVPRLFPSRAKSPPGAA